VVVEVTVYLWLALLTDLLGRLLRGPGGFERTFCVLVWASVPQLLSVVAFPWANQRWGTLHLWQGFDLVLSVWATVLLLVGLRVSYGFARWKTLLTALPAMGIFWALSLWAWVGVSFSPEASSPWQGTLKAAYPWQQAEGQRVIVFYPRGKSQGEIAKTVQGCDWALEQVCRVLEVQPPSFKVGVFWFPDENLLRRVVRDTIDSPAYAHDREISTAYATWQQMRVAVVHELAHVVIRNRIAGGMDPCALLGEGMASFVQNAVPETAWRNVGGALPRLTTSIPLHTLARDEVFRELAGSDTYAHACAFVRYLINRYGLAKVKQLCRETARGSWQGDTAEHFASAVRKVLGPSLAQLEQEWRQKEAPRTLAAFEEYAAQRPLIKQQGQWRVSLVRAMREKHLAGIERAGWTGRAEAVHLFMLVERLDKKPICRWGEQQTPGDIVRTTGMGGSAAATPGGEEMILGRSTARHECLEEVWLGEPSQEVSVTVLQGRCGKRETLLFRNVPVPSEGKVVAVRQEQVTKAGMKVRLVKVGYMPDDYGHLWVVLERDDPPEKIWFPSLDNREYKAVDERGRPLSPDRFSRVWGGDFWGHAAPSAMGSALFAPIHSIAFHPPSADTRRLTVHYPLYEWVETERSPEFTFDGIPQPLPR
jgi:hypothetical protein